MAYTVETPIGGGFRIRYTAHAWLPLEDDEWDNELIDCGRCGDIFPRKMMYWGYGDDDNKYCPECWEKVEVGE